MRDQKQYAYSTLTGFKTTALADLLNSARFMHLFPGWTAAQARGGGVWRRGLAGAPRRAKPGRGPVAWRRAREDAWGAESGPLRGSLLAARPTPARRWMPCALRSTST